MAENGVWGLSGVGVIGLPPCDTIKRVRLVIQTLHVYMSTSLWYHKEGIVIHTLHLYLSTSLWYHKEGTYCYSHTAYLPVYVVICPCFDGINADVGLNAKYKEEYAKQCRYACSMHVHIEFTHQHHVHSPPSLCMQKMEAK